MSKIPAGSVYRKKPGFWMKQTLGLIFEEVKGKYLGRFQAIPMRWKVERNWPRRLGKDYETDFGSHDLFVHLTLIE